MRTCSTCLHWGGDTTAYAADCALGILTRPAFDHDATRCAGYEARPDPTGDEAVHADLLALCAMCTAAEIQAVIDALPQLDGRWCDSTFAGVVAAVRGRGWGKGVPGIEGAYHDWEWEHIRLDGSPDDRVLLGQWLLEGLDAARERK